MTLVDKHKDGDFFVPVVRIDLLEKENLPLPHTWDDLITLAQYFNGTDLNDDGETHDDWGFCIYPRTGSGFNDAWIPELMYSTWATTDQTKGIQEGFLFDVETMEPRIDVGFEIAMNVWKDLWDVATDGCITSAFVEGRCAIVSSIFYIVNFSCIRLTLVDTRCYIIISGPCSTRLLEKCLCEHRRRRRCMA